MKIVSILLARTNFCKRIPKKPLAILGGRYLVEYTLHHMSMLPYPGYVFSDSEDVRVLAEQFKLNSGEKILENKNGIHYTSQELKYYNQSINADIIVLFQCTSPFRDMELVKEWIEKFPYWGVNCALTVRPIKLNLYLKDGSRIFPINRSYNNQELYKETGSIYIFSKNQIEKNHITDGTRKLLNDPYNFDIDTYDDLDRAEKFIQEAKR